MMEKAKGTAKEVAGKATGSDEMAREGEQQQQKAEKREEAQDLQAEAQQAEKQAAGHKSAEKKHQ